MTKKQIILTIKACLAISSLGLAPFIFNQINPYVGILSGIISFIFIISISIKLAKTTV